MGKAESLAHLWLYYDTLRNVSSWLQNDRIIILEIYNMKANKLGIRNNDEISEQY